MPVCTFAAAGTDQTGVARYTDIADPPPSTLTVIGRREEERGKQEEEKEGEEENASRVMDD